MRRGQVGKPASRSVQPLPLSVFIHVRKKIVPEQSSSRFACLVGLMSVNKYLAHFYLDLGFFVCFFFACDRVVKMVSSESRREKQNEGCKGPLEHSLFVFLSFKPSPQDITVRFINIGTPTQFSSFWFWTTSRRIWKKTRCVWTADFNLRATI